MATSSSEPTEPGVCRDLRPLGFTAAAAVVSVGWLTLSVVQGWLGADVGRGANFCEFRVDGPVRQPANTFSNLGFVISGLLIAWHARWPGRLGATFSRQPRLATTYACLVVLLGPASAAMHATQSASGGRLDLASMYLVAAFAAAYGAMRWWRRGTTYFLVLFIAFVAVCELAGSYDGPIPVLLHSGNLAFGAFLVAAVALEVLILRRGETRGDLRHGGAALGSLLLAFGIWNAAQRGWCDPGSLLQGHAAWHLLCAVAAYFLFRLYASEQDT